MSDTQTTFIDTGWSGTSDAINVAVETYGYQIANGIAALIDLTKIGPVLVIVAGPTLDNIAYVLVRSLTALPTPDGITIVGPDHTSALAGVFMSDGTEKPVEISYSDFDARWLAAEKNDLATVAYRLDAQRVANIPITLSLALLQGITLAAGNGTVTLNSKNMQDWMGANVMAGILTQERCNTILTP